MTTGEILKKISSVWDKIGVCWHYSSLLYMKNRPAAFSDKMQRDYRRVNNGLVWQALCVLHRLDGDGRVHARDMCGIMEAVDHVLEKERLNFCQIGLIGICLAHINVKSGDAATREIWAELFRARLDFQAYYFMRDPSPEEVAACMDVPKKIIFLLCGNEAWAGGPEKGTVWN